VDLFFLVWLQGKGKEAAAIVMVRPTWIVTTSTVLISMVFGQEAEFNAPVNDVEFGDKLTTHRPTFNAYSR
jgi:hypothetical protein